jgi:2-polyprenyl-6-methoxyphenol hydroxylase-like FAD-dependent oxidoreductase
MSGIIRGPPRLAIDDRVLNSKVQGRPNPGGALLQPKARVVVVGAGIAGLSCAIALTRAGADVEVVERVDELREVGGAVSLWPNALAALGRLGVEEAIRAVGWPEPTVTIRSSSGRDLVRLSADLVQAALGGEALIVHRADLQAVLLGAARDVPIRLSWACADIERFDSTIGVRSAGGDELRADAVVGCDGVRSVVGATLVGQRNLHYQGVTTWRAVLDGVDLVNSAWLAVGEGKQFVASPLVGSRCYWSPMLRMKEGANARLRDPIDFLSRASQIGLPRYQN